MHDLTTGSITRHLLKTAGFMLVTMIFQTLYFLIDLYWVGRLGKEAVAAVAIAGNLTFIVLAVSQMLGVGATDARLARDRRARIPRARCSCSTSRRCCRVVVAVIFLVAGMLLRGVYASELAADAATAEMARQYLTWFIPAMALQFLIVTMGAALRGTGNFKPGMIVGTASVIINMIFAPFLIFGWVTGAAFGVAGAAVSSLIAVVVATVWLGAYFVKPTAFLHYVPADWKPDFRMWWQMLKIGLPAGAEFGLMAVYLFIVYVISRPFGAAAQAGFGIGLRLVQAGFMPVVALGFSVAPVAGQNFGARLGDRVRHTFTVAASMAVGVMLVFAVACYFNAAAMVSFFSDDAGVIAVGTEYLRIIAWTFVGSGIIFVASSMFQAMGNTLPPLAASFARIVVVAVPAILMSRMPGFQLWWIWYLSVGALIFQLVTVLALLQREFRVRLAWPSSMAASSATAGTR